MDIEKALNVLTNPIYVRIILIIVAVVLLLRNIMYLILGDITYTFSGQQPQHVLEVIGLDIPALVMTILWPVVLAFLNIIHEKIKLEKDIFFSVMIVHAATCLFGAYMIYDGGCYQPYCDTNEFYTTVIGATILTFVSIILSVYLYMRPTLFKQSSVN